MTRYFIIIIHKYLHIQENTKILQMLLDSNNKNNEICEKIAESKGDNITHNTTHNTINRALTTGVFFSLSLCFKIQQIQLYF